MGTVIMVARPVEVEFEVANGNLIDYEAQAAALVALILEQVPWQTANLVYQKLAGYNGDNYNILGQRIE